LRSDETEATGKRRRVVDGERPNVEIGETNVNLPRLQKKEIFFLSNAPQNGDDFCEIPELVSMLRSGKTETCRWRKIRSIDEMVFTGANRNIRRKFCSTAILSTTNLSLNDLESKPSLRAERPERNSPGTFLSLED
jgi:hypothetical protein